MVFLVGAYTSGYHNIDDGAPKSGWAKSLEFLLPALRHLNKTPLMILDFGCGESAIPSKLRQEGHRVTAVDIMPPAKPYPDRLTGDILDLKLPAKSYDLIYSHQVFEHIAEPVPILQELLRILRPKGLLLIHTDMETQARAENDFLNWWYVLPPDHCSYYRPETFRKMLAHSPHQLIRKSQKTVLIEKNSCSR